MNKLIVEKECPHCGWSKAVIEQSGPHYKASCEDCGKFIKFISKEEFVHYMGKVVDSQNKEVTLEEINFKLDLLLTHFNIKE